MNNNTQQIKYVLYCRKSTESEDRQTLSLDDQERELTALESKERLNVVERYGGTPKGESQSAHKRGRPIFGRIMNLIEQGKINGILVWHPNRLARNAFDGGWLITMMDEGRLLEIRTPFRTYYNSPDDKFFLQLEFGMAKKSSDDSGVAIKRGLSSKVLKGWYPTVAPLGYMNNQDRRDGHSTIVRDPERFDAVRQLWQWMMTGNYTVMEILKKADKELGLKNRPTKKYPTQPIARSTLYHIFTNPFYYGYFEYGNPKQLYKGAHEPMVTEDEFDRIQILLGGKGKPRPKKHLFSFTGMMKCASCGAMVTAEEKVKRQKNGNVHHYVFYHCTRRKNPNCPERSIELKELNKQVDELISRFTISERFQKWALKYLHEVRIGEADANEQAFEGKQKSLNQTVKQLDALLLKYTSPENEGGRLISDVEYQSLKVRLQKEKESLERDLNVQSKSMDEWMELSERTFNFARYAKVWFEKGDRDTKRAIFATLGSNLLVKEQKLNVSLRKPFKLMFEALPEASREIERFVPLAFASTNQKTDSLVRLCPIFSRG